MDLDPDLWQDRLQKLVAQHDVVGASLAVRLGGQDMTAAAGVLHLGTGQPVTPGSVFQVGSITKVWTATLVMQLVDDGLVELDTPLVEYLPSFRVADPEVSRAITTRHLLTHTSGVDGDFFLDTGRGDDALARFVDAMATLEQNHPVGAAMSYNNAAFNLLGHLVAVLRDQPWEDVMRERLFEPLGTSAAGTLPEDALLHAAAMGHVADPETGEVMAAQRWGGFRSMGPAGLLHSTASEQVAFAQMHMDDGVGASGTRVLSAASAQAMRTPQVACIDVLDATHWGLGWALDDWDGQAVFRHSGNTSSQVAFLDAVPEAGLILALCTNGGRAPSELYEELAGELVPALTGLSMRAPFVPPTEPLPLEAERYLGTYRNAAFEATISGAEDDQLRMQVRVSGALVGMVPDMEYELVGLDGGDQLLGRMVGSKSWTHVVFVDRDGERWFHSAGRAFRKVA